MKFGITATEAYNYFGDDAYKKLASVGFTAVDFSLITTEKPIYLMPEEEATAQLLHHKKLAEEAGIEISQVHGPWRWPIKDSTEEDRAERMEKMKKSIKMCSILGCKYWVVHPLMPYGLHDLTTNEGERTWAINRDFFKALLPTAKEYGVTICYENMPMPEFSIGSPSQILDFVHEINDENFKVCLDTGHVAVYKEWGIGDAVRHLGKEIKVLHVHDNGGKADQHLAPYFGIINWTDFGQALKDIDFDGSFSLETVPSTKLPADLFLDMCATYCKISKNIMK